MSQKRKETQETHSVNKKKKNLQEEDCNSELASNQKPEIKVEVEYDPLFENEADLTIRGSLEDIKLDIFDENVFVDALPKIKDLHCGKQNDISSSTNENKGSSPHQSVAVKKVIEKQREALKLFQAALMKFESVTKDLQEMVELDIIEAQTEADSRLQETEIIGTDKEVQISKENSSSSLAKSIRSKRNNNEEEFPTASSSLEKSNFINDDLDAVEASQTQESGDKGLERIKDPNSKQDTASDTSSEGQANSDVERNSPLPSTSYDRNSPIPSTSYDRNSPLPSTSYDRNSPVPSTSYDIGVVATCQNRQGKGKIKDSNLKENASSDVSFYPNNEMGPHSSSSSKINSFEMGKKKPIKAEYISVLDSSDSEEDDITKHAYMYSSSSDDDDILPGFPTRWLNEKHVSDNHNRKEKGATVENTKNKNMALHIEQNESFSECTTPSVTSDVENEIRTLLRYVIGIRTQINTLDSKFEALVSNVDRFSETSKQYTNSHASCEPSTAEDKSVQEESVMSNFPIKSIIELEKIEKKLIDKQFKNEVIAELKKIGGKNIRTMVFNMLHATISNPVAVEYSWVGGKKKKPFSVLKLVEIFQEVVRYRHKDVTNAEISEPIKIFLVKAKERMERIEKKPKCTTIDVSNSDSCIPSN